MLIAQNYATAIGNVPGYVKATAIGNVPGYVKIQRLGKIYLSQPLTQIIRFLGNI